VIFKEWDCILLTQLLIQNLVFNFFLIYIFLKGNFDETDMGLDGQSMFMVAYSGKKKLG